MSNIPEKVKVALRNKKLNAVHMSDLHHDRIEDEDIHIYARFDNDTLIFDDPRNTRITVLGEFDFKIDQVYSCKVYDNVTNEMLRQIPKLTVTTLSFEKCPSITNFNKIYWNAEKIAISFTGIDSLDSLVGKYTTVVVESLCDKFIRIGGTKELNVNNLIIATPNRTSMRMTCFPGHISVHQIATGKLLNVLSLYEHLRDGMTIGAITMNNKNYVGMFKSAEDIYDLASKLLEAGFDEETVSV